MSKKGEQFTEPWLIINYDTLMWLNNLPQYSGGERLKVADVTVEIEEVLLDDYLFKVYGYEYSVILLKDILSKRIYWKDIPNTRWHCKLTY